MKYKWDVTAHGCDRTPRPGNRQTRRLFQRVTRHPLASLPAPGAGGRNCSDWKILFFHTRRAPGWCAGMGAPGPDRCAGRRTPDWMRRDRCTEKRALGCMYQDGYTGLVCPLVFNTSAYHEDEIGDASALAQDLRDLCLDSACAIVCVNWCLLGRETRGSLGVCVWDSCTPSHVGCQLT